MLVFQVGKLDLGAGFSGGVKCGVSGFVAELDDWSPFLAVLASLGCGFFDAGSEHFGPGGEAVCFGSVGCDHDFALVGASGPVCVAHDDYDGGVAGVFICFE